MGESDPFESREFLKPRLDLINGFEGIGLSRNCDPTLIDVEVPHIHPHTLWHSKGDLPHKVQCGHPLQSGLRGEKRFPFQLINLGPHLLDFVYDILDLWKGTRKNPSNFAIQILVMPLFHVEFEVEIEKDQQKECKHPYAGIEDFPLDLLDLAPKCELIPSEIYLGKALISHAP